jgi:hypothetical protein
MEKFATISVQMDVHEERVKDLMCCAWEGGASYWATLKAKNLTPAAKHELDLMLSERQKKEGDEACVYLGVPLH